MRAQTRPPQTRPTSEPGSRARDDLAGAAASVLVVAAVMALLAPITPAITSYEGWGFDGLRYREVVLALRGVPTAIYEPYAFRIGVPALVAALPLDIRTGFLAVNVAASLATGPLLFALLRSAGVARGPAILGVGWWSVLPMSLRYTLSYPTTLDAAGFALLVAAILLAVQHRIRAFAVVLTLGVLVRENVLAAVPLLWSRPRAPRPLVRAAAATAPAVAALILVRMLVPASGTPQAILVGSHLLTLLSGPEPAARYLGALALSLGLFAFVPVILGRDALRALRAQPSWAAYLAVTLTIAAIGGLDHDRFAIWLVPALGVLAFGARPGLWSDPRRAAAITALHVVAARPYWPLGTDANELLIATMTSGRLPAIVAVTAVAAVGAWAVTRWALTPRSASSPA